MKDKLLIILFLGLLYGFSIAEILLPDEKISSTEKRYLKQFPSYTFQSDYGNQIEDYLLDQFPLRNFFKTAKATYNYQLMRRIENNNYVLDKNGIYKLETTTNEKAIDSYLDYIRTTKNFLTKENKVALMIIPDKNQYFEKKDFLKLDLSSIEKKLKTLSLPEISLTSTLKLEDYYQTDIHWRQENLGKVVSSILAYFQIEEKQVSYISHEYPHFEGAYYKEAKIGRKQETLRYLSNEMIENVQVTYLENPHLKKVYNKEKLESFDAYGVYLDGASAYIEIENSKSLTSKELVLFRDSFGSSLAPLLIPYYRKITLIDNRYIGSRDYLKRLTFTNQDVLFLNSTYLINEGWTLKK